MNWEYIIALLIFTVLLALTLIIRKKTNRNKHYDERQLLLRANGYRIGFFVTSFALLVLILLTEAGVSLKVSTGLAMFIVLMMGIVTFAVYCIMRDVYFSVGESSKRYILFWTIIVVINAIPVTQRLIDGTFLENGILSFSGGGANFVCELSFLIVLVAIIVRKLQPEKEDEA